MKILLVRFNKQYLSQQVRIEGPRYSLQQNMASQMDRLNWSGHKFTRSPSFYVGRCDFKFTMNSDEFKLIALSEPVCSKSMKNSNQVGWCGQLVALVS